MAKFAVGEIAILVTGHPGWAKHFGSEVEVISVHSHTYYQYKVTAPWMEWPAVWAHDRNLRKRPQPPDWNALSNPEEVPIRELA